MLQVAGTKNKHGKAWQKGRIVSMTGDGVNHCTGIKMLVYIGVAMDITGTEVAKDCGRHDSFR